jgi:intein/homing endonuclease
MAKQEIEFLQSLIKDKFVGENTAGYGHGEQIYEPVSVEKFFQTRYYSGFGKGDVFRYWIDIAEEFISTGKNELIITGSLGSGKCIEENQRIHTSQGYHKIKDTERGLYLGDNFYHTDLKVHNHQKATKFYDGGVKSTRKLVTKELEITGTLVHPLKVLRDGEPTWVPIKQIVIGDLLVGDPTRDILFNNKTPDISIFNTTEVNKGYIIGALLGDGGVSIGKKSYKTYWCGTKEFISYIESQLSCEYKLYKDDRRDDLWSLHINSKALALEMVKLGLAGASYEKDIPEWVFSSNEEFLIGLISGLVYTDGSVQDRSFEFSSASINLATKFRELLKLFKVYSSISYKKGKNRVLVGDRYIRRLDFLYNIFYKEDSNRHILKRVSAGGKGLPTTHFDGSIVINDSKLKGVIENNIRATPERLEQQFDLLNTWDLFEVLEVQDAGPLQVYDLHVPGTHEFEAEGLINHNTTAANLIAAYKIYDLFSYKDVNSYLGLPAIQDIYNIYFSVSALQAKRTGFAQLRNIIDNSEWFTKNAPRNKNISSSLEFHGGKFQFVSGSGPSHQIGLTIWSFILDEADFFSKNGTGFDENYEKVTTLYGELLDRRTSRFKKFGKDLSFSALISSASFQSSFVDQRIEQAAEDPGSMIVRAVAYKMKPKGTFAEEKFVVFTGLEAIEPELVNDNKTLRRLLEVLKCDYEVLNSLTVIQNVENLPLKFRQSFEFPPMDLYIDYKRNLQKALMNHSGLATARIGKLFQSKALLRDQYDAQQIHPFSRTYVEVSTGDDIAIRDYFYSQYIERKGQPHSFHLDQSVSGDSTGISLVRFDGVRTDANGNKSRHYTQVFSLEIKPPPAPYQIKISKVLDFIVYLRDEVKINIVKGTTDQYQCGEKGTKVWTTKGVKNIEDITPGVVIYGRSGLAPVKSVLKKDNEKVLKVRTKRGYEFGATPEHRMLASTEYKNLKSHQPNRFHEWGWKIVGELNIGDVMWINTEQLPDTCEYQSVPKYDSTRSRIDKGFKPTHLTEDIAELLGFYLGDGTLYEQTMQITLGTDGDREAVQRICKNILGYEIPLGKRSLNFGGKNFVKWLKEIGFTKLSSHKKYIPEIILRSPRSVKAAFLRGLYGADGSVSEIKGNEGQVSLASTSKRLIDQVKLILNFEFGIKTSTTKGKREYEGDYDNAKPVYYLRNSGGRDKFEQVGFSTEDKQLLFDQYLEVQGRTTWDKIVSIEEDVSDVYDLEIDGDPSYIANGFMSHNSTMLRQELAAREFNMAHQSVDKNDEPYLIWMDLLMNGQMHHYEHELLEKEAFAEIHDRAKRKCDHPKGGCFTGDTKIKMLDGTHKRLDEITDEEFYVYGCDAAGQVIPTKGRNARITKFTDKLTYVTLDNGEVVKCTPDHPWMLRDGFYKDASELNVGDSLMPLYTDLNHNGYERYWCNMEHSWKFTHSRVADKFGFGVSSKEEVIHHHREKTNNIPNHLQRMTREEHCKWHSEVLSKNTNATEVWERRRISLREKAIERITKFFDTCEIEKEANDFIKQRDWLQPVKDQTIELLAVNGVPIVWAIRIFEWRKEKFYRLNRSDSVRKRSSERAVKRNKTGVTTRIRNHKVVSVVTKKVERQPVYDITVPETSNFALSAGVFVHNSHDVLQSLVGAVRNLTEMEDLEEYNADMEYDVYKPTEKFTPEKAFDMDKIKVTEDYAKDFHKLNSKKQFYKHLLAD